MKAKHLHLLLLLLVCFFTFFLHNKVIHTDIMESRNIITAREMVYDGHWMVPTMNGELRLEKPPLPTWIAAGVEMAFPDDMGAQRAMAGLAATLLVFFFYLFGKELTKNSTYALVSSLVLCTSYNIILMGRTASWDIYCHAFMMGAIYFLYKGLQNEGRQWGKFFGAGVFLGLSFLGKGPVSFYALLLPFLVSYTLFLRRPLKGKKLPILLTLLVCLLVSGWWYIFIYLFHTEEARYVLDKESTAWVERNVRPWYYYGTFFLETGVWALMILITLAIPYWNRKLRMNREYLSTLCWMLFLVIFLSLLPEKKNRYLLPVLIPAAYTIGFLFIHWTEEIQKRKLDRTGRWFYLINAGLVTLIIIALPVTGYFMLYPKGISLSSLLWLTALLWGLAAFMITSITPLRPMRFLSGVVMLFLIAELFCMPYIGGLVNNPEFKSIRGTREVESLKRLPFYSVAGQELRIELVYEANKKIRPLNIHHTDEVMKALPCAILTHGRVGEELPASLLEKIDTVWVGHYDNNRRPKNTKRYSDLFLYNVTILRQKPWQSPDSAVCAPIEKSYE